MKIRRVRFEKSRPLDMGGGKVFSTVEMTNKVHADLIADLDFDEKLRVLWVMPTSKSIIEKDMFMIPMERIDSMTPMAAAPAKAKPTEPKAA